MTLNAFEHYLNELEKTAQIEIAKATSLHLQEGWGVAQKDAMRKIESNLLNLTNIVALAKSTLSDPMISK